MNITINKFEEYPNKAIITHFLTSVFQFIVFANKTTNVARNENINESDIIEKGLTKNMRPITNPNISSEENFDFNIVLLIVINVTSNVALNALIGKFNINKYAHIGIRANQLAYNSGTLTTLKIF